MWKKALMHVAIHQASSMLWSRWFINSVRERFLRIGSSSGGPMEIRLDLGLVRSVGCRLSQQTDQGRGTGVVRHGKADPLERSSLPHLKPFVLGKQHWLFTRILYNYTQHDFRPQLCPGHEWDLTSSFSSECRDFSHMAAVTFSFFLFRSNFYISSKIWWSRLNPRVYQR